MGKEPFDHGAIGTSARPPALGPARAHGNGGRDMHAAVAREERGLRDEATTADPDRPARGGAPELDALDPAVRHAAQLGPPMAAAIGEGAAREAVRTEPVLRARSLEELLPALVRRIAWAGDRHAGTVRLELGAGAYAGTTVTVHAEGGRVRVELAGPGDADVERLRARLDARLRNHGLDVESVT